MLLAQLEVFHSRPIAPTRRLALGHRELPVDPPPGPGGVLLGGIMATVAGEFDTELEADLLRLTIQVEDGRRVVQPRLRHRLQTDRVGLSRSYFSLVQRGESDLEFGFDETTCTPLQGALSAIYAAGSVPRPIRPRVMDSIRRGLRWGGDLGPDLVVALSGGAANVPFSAGALSDPRGWACGVLGFEDRSPERKAVLRAFRDALRDVHPDHGAVEENAADRIAEITEARRILLT